MRSNLPVLLATVALASPAFAEPLSSAFTYQGRLVDAGAPANGTYDFQFRLYDAAAGGLQAGVTQCANDVQVVDGQFTVRIDFGPNAFSTAERYLEIDARADSGLSCGNATGYATLSPRTEVHPAPYSRFALNASAAIVANDASALGGQPASFYTSAANLTAGTVPDARLSANVPLISASNAFSASQSIATNLGANGLLVTHNNNNTSQAIRGVTTGGTALVHGGFFESTNSTSGVGVQGQALAATGLTRGVWGKVNSASGWAGYFEGRGFFSSAMGIGIDTPEAPLHVMEGASGVVTANANASAVFERSTANYLQILTPDVSEKGVIFGSPSSSVQAGIYYTNGQSMNFRTGGNSIKMRLTDAGDVGIGITTPAAKLHVGGNVQIDGTITIPTTTRFLNIPGAGFIPANTANSTVTFISSGLIRGTALPSAGLLQATAPVNLPDGAVITDVTLYVLDNLPGATCSAGLYTRAIASTAIGTNLRTLTTSVDSASLQTLAGTLTTPHTVNNTTNCYWVWLQWGYVDATSHIDIYGYRITYTIDSPTP